MGSMTMELPLSALVIMVLLSRSLVLINFICLVSGYVSCVELLFCCIYAISNYFPVNLSFIGGELCDCRFGFQG
jgi:hypothetical protein